MYKLKIWLACFTLAFVSVAHAQQTKTFQYAPEQPVPGDTLKITYNPAATPLAGKKDVRAVVYLFSNYHWQVNDLPMKATSDNKFQAIVPLDKACGLVTFKFMAGDSTDNNHELSYTIMTADPVLKPYSAPSAYAGWGLLRAQRFGYGIPGYFKKEPKLTDTAFYYWMNNEIVRHPKESSLEVAVPFAQGVYAYQGTDALPRIRNVIGFLNKLGGEENLLKIRKIYLEALRQKTAVDSLDAIMLAQFPKGNVAALKAYRLANQERDLSKKTALSEQFLADFPQAQANRQFDIDNNISYSTVYQTIIVLHVMNKDYDIIKKYIDNMPYSALIGTYYKVIQIAHDRKDVADEKLYPYAKMLVDRMETLRNRKPDEYWYLSPSEWQQQFEKDFVKSVLVTHVNLLKNIGQYDDALKYALEAQALLKYKRAPLNNDEVALLKQKGQTKEINEVLIKSMYENQATPEMIDLLKSGYVAQYKSDDGFDKYLESLKNAAISAASTEKMEMINKDMPDWSMYDATGKLIKFKDLRGKTIVMDFWATWCVPCKASFPGMKLAVEKYKNDPNVQFYFVDTEERTADYKAQVNKYINDNNYPFHILFDNKVNGGKMTEEVYNKICKAFGISGIPQKLIIDKNGKVRFNAVGFNGSASELADEISAMVEKTKKAN